MNANTGETYAQQKAFPVISKKRLSALSKLLAYQLLDNSTQWQEHDTGKSLLDMKEGEPLGPGMVFGGNLMEVGADGKLQPLRDEMKAQMREFSANTAGTRDRIIDIPNDWSPEEAALACLVTEGALFRLGFKPYIFRDIGELVEISMDSGYTPDTLPEKITLRTNVSGAIETLDYKTVSQAIDETLDSITAGWKLGNNKGQPTLTKPTELESTFPFIDQFAELYARAADEEDSLTHVAAKKGGLAHCTPSEAERHMALIDQAGYPYPRVAVSLKGKLAEDFMSDMEIKPQLEIDVPPIGPQDVKLTLLSRDDTRASFTSQITSPMYRSTVDNSLKPFTPEMFSRWMEDVIKPALAQMAGTLGGTVEVSNIVPEKRQYDFTVTGGMLEHVLGDIRRRGSASQQL